MPDDCSVFRSGFMGAGSRLAVEVTFRAVITLGPWNCAGKTVAGVALAFTMSRQHK